MIKLALLTAVTAAIVTLGVVPEATPQQIFPDNTQQIFPDNTMYEKFSNIIKDIDTLSNNIQTCRNEAFGASTHTTDAKECTIAANNARHACETAVVQVAVIKGKVLALRPPLH